MLQELDTFLKMAAVLLGGVWVLMNYLRGRTHKPRLQLRISAERTFHGVDEFLVITNELHNAGLSRVNVVNDGCKITVHAHRLPKRAEFVMQPRWEKLAVLDLYKDEHWVEPNGLLIDSQVVSLPGLADRFLSVWAHFESSKVAWNARVVVMPLAASKSQLTGGRQNSDLGVKRPERY
jgi:hypothetical protein